LPIEIDKKGVFFKDTRHQANNIIMHENPFGEELSQHIPIKTGKAGVFLPFLHEI
jgi:hypothetical protein